MHRRAPVWPGLPLTAAVLLVGMSGSARAFDLTAYKARYDAVVAEVKAKPGADIDTVLDQLVGMVDSGKSGAQDYAAREPKFAKLMQSAIADADAMRAMTDEEIEDTWGEQGNAGDAVGVPLTSLGQWDATRAYLELMVGPSHAYIFLKKWRSTHKPALLDKANEELQELGEHLKAVN